MKNTLEAMHRGGIYDHLGYGFARYSVDGKWLVPHFEKMLYDNALLAMAYLEGYQVTGKERFARIAREIFTYVLRDMTSPAGAFYTAEDADPKGRRGSSIPGPRPKSRESWAQSWGRVLPLVRGYRSWEFRREKYLKPGPG